MHLPLFMPKCCLFVLTSYIMSENNQNKKQLLIGAIKKM